MRQIREFRSNIENISRDSCATVARQSRDIRESVSRLSRECNLFSFKFVRQSRDIRASVARHSYECRLVLLSRQIVGRFSQDCRATVVQHSRDIRTSVAKISHCRFAKISWRQFGDTRTNVARTSRDRRTTVARQSCEIFWRKNSHKIFQHVEKLRDQFATSSRHKKILTTLARLSCESPRQNSQNSREKFVCQ